MLLFSHPVVSNSLRPHGLQLASLPCPLPSPEVCPSSCSLHWWCCPAISSSDTLFSFCPQSFPASGTFPTSCLFASGYQNIGVSASASVLPISVQGWFPLRLTGLILLSKGLSGVFSSTAVWRHQFFGVQPSLQSSSHNRTWPLERPLPWLYGLLWFVIAFLPRSNRLLILWLQSPSTVILEPRKRKSVTASTFSPSIGHEVMGPDLSLF